MERFGAMVLHVRGRRRLQVNDRLLERNAERSMSSIECTVVRQRSKWAGRDR